MPDRPERRCSNQDRSDDPDSTVAGLDATSGDEVGKALRPRLARDADELRPVGPWNRRVFPIAGECQQPLAGEAKTAAPETPTGREPSAPSSG
jgi:hypothetical protein